MAQAEYDVSKESLAGVVKLAVAQGLVSEAQVSEAEAICARLEAETGIKLSLSEALVKKGCLSQAQIAELEKKQRMASIARVIPGYELQVKLGQGAMGTVFRACQKSLDRIVAIKILPPSAAKNPGVIERFRREAHAAGKLNHPNIVLGIDVGEANGLHYLVMEYVNGPTLRRVSKERGALGEAEVLKIARQIGSALEEARRHGMIHRDIKPENIMLTQSGDAKLCDLGLSRMVCDDSALTRADTAIGTPWYISPEQAQGVRDIDIRADIYSLGATLYHLLTGHPMFLAETSAAVMTAHVLNEAVHPQALAPKLSNGMVQVLRCMLAKDRAERYPDPAVLCKDLDALAGGARPPFAAAFRGRSGIPAAAPSASAARAAVRPSPGVPSESTRNGTSAVNALIAAAGGAPASGAAPAETRRSRLRFGLALALAGVAVLCVVYRLTRTPKPEQKTESGISAAPVPEAPPGPAPIPVLKWTRPAPPPDTQAADPHPGLASGPMPVPMPGSMPVPPLPPPEAIAAPVPKPLPEQAPALPVPPGETVKAAGLPPVTAAIPAPQPSPQPASKPPVPKPFRGTYDFCSKSQMDDWRQIEPGWVMTPGALVCSQPALNHRIELTQVLEGSGTISYSGATLADMGISFADPEKPDRCDRVVAGGMDGGHAGILTADKSKTQLVALRVGDGRTHDVQVSRNSESLALTIDGKETARVPLTQLVAPKRFRLRLHAWEKSARFESLSVTGFQPVQ